jgi:hypothetical protein
MRYLFSAIVFFSTQALAQNSDGEISAARDGDQDSPFHEAPRESVEWNDGTLRKGLVFALTKNFEVDPFALTARISDRDRQPNGLDEDFEFCGIMPVLQNGRGQSTERQRVGETFAREFIDPITREKALFRLTLEAKKKPERLQMLKKLRMPEKPTEDEIVAMSILRIHRREIENDMILKASTDKSPRRYRIEKILKYQQKSEDNLYLGYEFQLVPIDPVPPMQTIASITCFRHVLEDRLPQEVWDASAEAEDNQSPERAFIDRAFKGWAISQAAANELLAPVIRVYSHP